MRKVILAVLALMSQAAFAETVSVKYLGNVSLADFDCVNVTESSDVKRICYDQAEQYMLIKLNSTYYQYCELDASTITGLKNSKSKREYFERRIKGTGSDGPFDCRTHPVPKKYQR